MTGQSRICCPWRGAAYPCSRSQLYILLLVIVVAPGTRWDRYGGEFGNKLSTVAWRIIFFLYRWSRRLRRRWQTGGMTRHQFYTSCGRNFPVNKAAVIFGPMAVPAQTPCCNDSAGRGFCQAKMSTNGVLCTGAEWTDLAARSGRSWLKEICRR